MTRAAFTVEDLLAEPPVDSRWWLPSVYGRLRARGQEVKKHGKRGRPDVLTRTRLERAARAPNLLVVGDRLSRSVGPAAFEGSRSGYHLWRALRLGGWDELEAVVVNARDREGRVRQAELVRAFGEFDQESSVLLLGREAVRAWRRIFGPEESFKPCDVVEVEHPQHHLRGFEGPAAYRDRMARAGLRLRAPLLLEATWTEDAAPAVAGAEPRPVLAVKYAPVVATVPEEAKEEVDGRAREAILERRIRTLDAIADHGLEKLSDRVRSGEVVLTLDEVERFQRLAASLRGDRDAAVAALEEAAGAARELYG